MWWLLVIRWSTAAAAARVAVVTSSNCNGVANYAVQHPERGEQHTVLNTQFAASLLALFHLKETFPEWDAMLVSDSSRWHNIKCRETFDAFARIFEARYAQKLEVVNVRVGEYQVLARLAQTSGKETDHSRGHWPVDAYMHLVAPAPLLELGYDYTVYVDPDVFFLDSSLVAEISEVEGIGCISAIPPQCLVMDIAGRRSQVLKGMHDEYRLVSDPTLRGRVVEVARRKYGGYLVKNSTNSGLVIYNNKRLVEAGWVEWLAELFEVSTKGFYGDQTALTAAYGRADVPVRWLDPRFNVGLTFPKDGVRTTCGADVRHSKNAVTGANVSSVHFIWGPKPWMSSMSVRHVIPSKFAVQADVKYATLYRRFARSVLPESFVGRYFGVLGDLNHSVVGAPYAHGSTFTACVHNPDPCGRPPPTLQQQVAQGESPYAAYHHRVHHLPSPSDAAAHPLPSRRRRRRRL